MDLMHDVIVNLSTSEKRWQRSPGLLSIHAPLNGLPTAGMVIAP
jgi:hypothetical protein